mmetsp:Transcript_50982/g.61436  ORF Transcript_50982/g.61436 Transcript_50982/m.61436 type:complete len:312 (-) Transcript_50982:304-1239(-)
MNAAKITTLLRLEDLRRKIAHNKRIKFSSTDGLDSYEAYFNIIDGSDEVAVLHHIAQFVETMRTCGCMDTATWEKVMLRMMRGTAADYWIERREAVEDGDKSSAQEVFFSHVKNWLHNWFDEDDGANLNAYLCLGVQKPRDVNQADFALNISNAAKIVKQLGAEQLTESEEKACYYRGMPKHFWQTFVWDNLDSNTISFPAMKSYMCRQEKIVMLTKKCRETRESGGQASGGRKKSRYEDQASRNRSPSGNEQRRHNNKQSRDGGKGGRHNKPASRGSTEGDKSACRVHRDHEWYQCKFHPTGPDLITAKF